MIFYLGNIILFFCVYYFLITILSVKKDNNKIKHNKFEKRYSNDNKTFITNITKKFPRLFKINFFQGFLNNLKLKLEYAGLSEKYTNEEYFMLHISGLIGSSFLAIILSIALINSDLESISILHILLVLIIFPLIGFFLPSLKLQELISSRRKEIMNDLPFMLDLITISVEAGLDFSQAVERIIERSEMSELIYELNLFMQETKLGKRRSEALARMATRINIKSFSAIISNIIQAEKLGTSIGSILKIQSKSLRQKRMQETEKTAMEAPVKMIIPLALFIFPSVFIVLLGPLIIQFLNH